MSKGKTQPEEKGFFEKIKESIEEFWDGTKENAEDLKDKAEDKFEDLKEKTEDKIADIKKKVAIKKPEVAKKATFAKAVIAKKADAVKESVAKKVTATTAKAKTETADIKTKADTKAKAITAKAKPNFGPLHFLCKAIDLRPVKVMDVGCYYASGPRRWLGIEIMKVGAFGFASSVGDQAKGMLDELRCIQKSKTLRIASQTVAHSLEWSHGFAPQRPIVSRRK